MEDDRGLYSTEVASALFTQPTWVLILTKISSMLLRFIDSTAQRKVDRGFKKSIKLVLLHQ